MPKFKSKVLIEAFQMTQESRRNNADWPQWLHAAWDKDRDEPGAFLETMSAIRTVDGAVPVNVNDWIIRGENGELYPCKPDIFEKTYEPA